MTTENLPSPVSAYVQATNDFNLERLLETFHDDALVIVAAHPAASRAP